MAKSTEEKIKEIFLRKLAVKIQGIKLEIAESLYLQYLFDDIVLLAETEMNLELAIEKKYESIKEENPDLDLDKKIIDETLRSVLAEYKSEIEVYNDYFSKKNNPKILKRQLYTEILKKLNDEPKHLTARLHEILRYHLSPMVENVDTDKMGLSKEDLL